MIPISALARVRWLRRQLVALRDMPRSGKLCVLLAVDLIVVLIAHFAAIALDPLSAPAPLARLADLCVLLAVAAVASHALGLPRVQLKSFEARGMGRSALLGGLLGGVALASGQILGQTLSVAGVVLFASLFVIGSVCARYLMLYILRALYELDAPARTVVIYGAGATGMQLAMALRPQNAIRVLGFVDDNRALQGVTVAGLPVYPPRALPALARQHNVQRVLMAMPSLSAPQQVRIARRMADLGLDVQRLPSFAQLVGEEELVATLTEALPDAFLSRPAHATAIDAASGAYRGKSVLISGAGGSIGSELCRQLLLCRPRRLVLLDASEHVLYQIDAELRELSRKSETQIVPRLGSVTERRLLAAALAENEVDVVIHAAAYKHVPLVEDNVLAGIANNVLGTATLAQAAARHGVERFILVSTDKAVRPASVMGATKRIAELLIGNLARHAEGNTVFSMVRFGNVLGSSGSVMPRFRDQIASGGPVTITHPEVTRYFMTIQEATQLLLRAGALARGGDVFVLDMGKPVRIIELARQMVQAAGLSVRDADSPDGDIEIAVTGLRPGEKLHEELSITGARQPTAHPKIFAVREVGLTPFQVSRAYRGLCRALAQGDPSAARRELMHWVGLDLDALGAAAPAAVAPSAQDGVR